MSRNGKVVDSIDTVLGKLWTVVMVIALGVMSVSTLMQIVLRVTGGPSWEPFVDIITYSFTIATFSGGALLFRGRYHLAVDFFVDRLHGTPRRVAVWVSDAVSLLTCFGLAYLSVSLVQSGMGQFSPTLGIPMGWIYTIVPLTLLSAVFFIWRHGFGKSETAASDQDDTDGTERVN